MKRMVKTIMVVACAATLLVGCGGSSGGGSTSTDAKTDVSTEA